MDLCTRFLLRFDSKNQVLKPYHALFNLSRDAFTQDNNLITLFSKYYHVFYIELRLLMIMNNSVSKKKSHLGKLADYHFKLILNSLQAYQSYWLNNLLFHWRLLKFSRLG